MFVCVYIEEKNAYYVKASRVSFMRRKKLQLQSYSGDLSKTWPMEP